MSAQTAGSTRPAIARALFEQGLEEASAGHLERARELFLRSREAAESVSTLLNLAIVRAKLGEWGQALAALDDLEALLLDAPEDPALLRAQGLRKDLTPLVASVQLELVPSEARVSAEGAARAQSPGARRLYFTAGQHTLRVEAPGHEPETRTLTFSRGEERSERFSLLPTPTITKAQASPPSLPPVALTPSVGPTAQPTSEQALATNHTRARDQTRKQRIRRTLWIGGAALVVAAGVTAALLLRPADEGDFPI